MKQSPTLVLTAAVLSLAALGCRPDLTVNVDARSAYQDEEDVRGTVFANVENVGSAAAAGTASAGASGYMVDLVLSTDGTVPVAFATVPSPYVFQDDMLLVGGRISNTVDLAAGASHNYDGHGGKLPPGTPTGSYLCAVVDPNNVIAESDETNNTSCVQFKVVP
ncbi:MAG: CARDB domain-containing protein [Thermoanaerobaculia bacterium]|nr:CARDB domain-containing protein [Thermoanaerobaculia bacterium]